MPIIEVDHVSKIYPARRGARDLRGRGGLGDWLRGRGKETFAALDDISLSVEPGESLGIIGRNGSGKSTLLKILAGVTLPSSGRAVVHGRVASLLELGAGFHPILTGRENIYLNAGLLGMRHAQVDEVVDEIIAFSGIGEFIDQPVDTYSSGMYVRIGFAVAAHTNPDIFLVDEVLAVGDEEFQRKCRRRIGELREQGKSIVFVSHDLGTVNALCERVALLSQGKMIVRDTPQKTINYYLRQVGREGGVHTFSQGASEGIQCDGRVSLFHQGEELTTAQGFWMQLESLGQHHASNDAAEWEVLERSERGCTARGQMTRLPVSLHWDLNLEAGKLRWQAALECDHPVELPFIETCVALPTAYARWLHGDFAGAFPDILPSDAHWNVLASPEQDTEWAAALPAKDASLPPVLFHLIPAGPNVTFAWANSNYALFSRLLLIHARRPQEDCLFAEGRHPLFTLEVDWTASHDSLLERIQAETTLRCGALSARFEQGKVRIAADGEEVTGFLHVYSSMLIDSLWNDSHALQWGRVESDGRRLEVTGASRRFPFKQRWELTIAEDGLHVAIWLVVTEAFAAQEYHLSAVLRPEYEAWETDHEKGAFAPFDPSLEQWQHLNKSYAPGRRITALSSSLVSVRLELEENTPPFSMTAINTKANEHGRVLQALRPSSGGALQFKPGEHLYFSGTIRLAPPGTPKG